MVQLAGWAVVRTSSASRAPSSASLSLSSINHALVETTTGLTSEMLRSDTFAPGLFSRVGVWLREHKLT